MEATKADPTVPAYWSNMAASHEKLGNWAEMADAGRNCVKADSKFVKGYFRLATAMKNLKNMAECIKTLESGLGVDSSNSYLKNLKMEVEAIQVSVFRSSEASLERSEPSSEASLENFVLTYSTYSTYSLPTPIPLPHNTTHPTDLRRSTQG